MPSQPPNSHPDQSFLDTERLFRRVARENLKANGKATFLAFELPDMSVNREKFSTAEETRKGFRPEDWGVVSIRVGEIPPRQLISQVAHHYLFRPRHVPETGNFAHSEIRVWRIDGQSESLITNRTAFDANDPDRDAPRRGANELDPEFHMRWRKQIEWKCQPELMPVVERDNDE